MRGQELWLAPSGSNLLILCGAAAPSPRGLFFLLILAVQEAGAGSGLGPGFLLLGDLPL